MQNSTPEIGHNGSVTTPATFAPTARGIKRPDPVAVGTIVWLGSEVMFFAGLFAIYFTLKSTSPALWAEQTEKLNVPYALTNTLILVASSFTCQFGVFAAERLQARRTGGLFNLSKWGVVEWMYLTFAMGAVFVSAYGMLSLAVCSDHSSGEKLRSVK